MNNTPMTPEEFKQAMADAEQYGVEEDHLAMDDIMCTLLRSLGYGEGIDIFDNIDKWYG